MAPGLVPAGLGVLRVLVAFLPRPSPEAAPLEVLLGEVTAGSPGADHREEGTGESYAEHSGLDAVQPLLRLGDYGVATGRRLVGENPPDDPALGGRAPGSPRGSRGAVADARGSDGRRPGPLRCRGSPNKCGLF